MLRQRLWSPVPQNAKSRKAVHAVGLFLKQNRFIHQELKVFLGPDQRCGFGLAHGSQFTVHDAVMRNIHGRHDVVQAASCVIRRYRRCCGLHCLLILLVHDTRALFIGTAAIRNDMARFHGRANLVHRSCFECCFGGLFLECLLLFSSNGKPNGMSDLFSSHRAVDLFPGGSLVVEFDKPHAMKHFQFIDNLFGQVHLVQFARDTLVGWKHFVNVSSKEAITRMMAQGLVLGTQNILVGKFQLSKSRLRGGHVKLHVWPVRLCWFWIL